MATTPTTAFITGAGNGIGRAVALLLASKGWKIGALDQSEKDLESLQKEMDQRKLACGWAEADVTHAEDLRRAVAELESKLGPATLLLACAGKANDTPAQTMDVAAIEQLVRLNLLGVVNSIAAVLPGMLERRAGHLAAISSLASLHPLPRQMAYCASKAGLNALMESIRLDVKDRGIVVSTICPGWTRTRQTKKFDDEDLMDVNDTARYIVWALERRKRFYAFPWPMVWQLRLMRLLPRSIQDWLLVRRLDELRKDETGHYR
jgi:short-subunit dehydrogenase